MSDSGKSFLERRQEAEILAAQIKEIAPNVQSVSFIERQEVHHHHHHSAPRTHALEELAKALSRCRTIDANDLVDNRVDNRAHAAAVAARHVSMAEARKARCVLAEMRWR